MSIETLQPPAQGTVHPDLSKAATPPAINGPDPDKIVFFAGQFDDLDEEKDKLKAKEKKIRQQAMNQGITLDMMKRVRADLLLDPETVMRREAEYRHYMQAFDSPIGTQLSLFPTQLVRRELSQKEQLDKAFARGKTLGILAKDPDEQAYPPHTDLGQEHRRGWNEGQKINHDYFLSIQEETDDAEAEAAAKKEAKLAEQKKKTEERAAAKRDAAAAKLAEKERKAAEKKAAKEAAAAKKKARAEEERDPEAKKPGSGARRGRGGARKH